jgi:uncharacterized protein
VRKVKFYDVSQTICCTLHDIKKILDLATEAVAAGATGVHEATLRTSKLRNYRDDARIKAIQAAKEKALALAAELGTKVGKPYSVTEGPAYDWRGVMNASNNAQVAVRASGDAGDEETNATFAPGMIKVSQRQRIVLIGVT